MALVKNPLFARYFNRFGARREERGNRELRREMLAGLSGRVIEVGPGNGLNFPHYPLAVREVVAVEPEPYLRARATEAAAAAPVPVRVADGTAGDLPAADGDVQRGRRVRAAVLRAGRAGRACRIPPGIAARRSAAFLRARAQPGRRLRPLPEGRRSHLAAPDGRVPCRSPDPGGHRPGLHDQRMPRFPLPSLRDLLASRPANHRRGPQDRFCLGLIMRAALVCLAWLLAPELPGR